MKKTFLCLITMIGALVSQASINPEDIRTSVSIKVPGNNAKTYSLSTNGAILTANKKLPLEITRAYIIDNNDITIKLTIKANESSWFRINQELITNHNHKTSMMYMPGFWYRQNMRSPKEAPSFKTSYSWTVREDRLSTPLTGVYSEDNGTYTNVTRIADYKTDALSTHYTGEIMLSGKTDVGYTGFESRNGYTAILFGFPYQETPKAYIRKLTLAPSVYAYQKINKGESITLQWVISEGSAKDFSQFIQKTWEYCYDTYRPKQVSTPYSNEQIKSGLTKFFKNSYVDKYPLKYMSGVGIRTDNCKSTGIVEIGFVGRVLLNAFNALEYGESHSNSELVQIANSVFNSFENNIFSAEGFFNEVVNYDNSTIDDVHSIRRQSEGITAILHYLNYEKKHGRKHPTWEKRIRAMLDKFITLQNSDGSFPRKFKDDYSIVDMSGGSTPSATIPLVMGYKYFKDKKYLNAAKHTADYLEKEIISKADYFSSTLDANCEDKEASIAAATATYYLALVTSGKEQHHYADLSHTAAFFALSWYYTYDVPYAQGQMLGDIGMQSRGWANVSVENNHIDVFVFEFGSVLEWLGKKYNEDRFTRFANVISTSMKQLLPTTNNLCGISNEGYYPEVVQHTHWDYGKNGKGYYNDIFAPGWVAASLWELYTPQRAEKFLK